MVGVACKYMVGVASGLQGCGAAAPAGAAPRRKLPAHEQVPLALVGRDWLVDIHNLLQSNRVSGERAAAPRAAEGPEAAARKRRRLAPPCSTHRACPGYGTVEQRGPSAPGAG